MQTIQLEYPHNLDIVNLPKTTAAIGFFDGIHKGHQALINTAVEKTRDNAMESAVISFDPHPSVVLNPNIEHVDYITPIKEKQAILEEMNVDRFYIITFDTNLSNLSPQAFIDHFIIGLNIVHLVTGFDFSYGHKGKGNVDTLPSHSRDSFQITVMDKVEFDNEKVSSTKIRQLFADGDIKMAAHLLGRFPHVSGEVVEGFHRGRTLGYPTANIDVSPYALLPPPGVYAVILHHDGEVFEAMANLGFNPTFETTMKDPSLEVFLFDYTGDLYGAHVKVEWCAFIREEKAFNDMNDLIEEMQNDEHVIRSFFTEENSRNDDV